MLEGRRFVIAGLSRLTVRLVETLTEHHAEVVVIGDPLRDGERAAEAMSMLPDDVRVVVPGRDHDQAFLDAGLLDASGLLALSDDDLENLRYVADAHELAPDVPIVLRTFQPELADHLSKSLNIRRAYSVAALAAPAFVAASFDEHVVVTLRLADEEIPLCVLDVDAMSPLVGMDLTTVKTATLCGVVAVRAAGHDWQPATDSTPALGAGDRVLVGGRHADVLRLAAQNDPDVAASVRSHRRRRRWRPQRITATLLPISAALFFVLFVITTLVNRAVFDLDLTDAMSVALNAALGGSTPITGYEWVQIFNLLSTIAGTILLWILLSHITALVLAERFEQRMTKRASRMTNHVVVVGLGKLGYRVVQLLDELGVPTVAIEHTPDSRFLDAVATHTPVLTGDGQLAENLERCGVENARCIIAATNDDLANLASCLEARNLNPDIRTVTRVFDDRLATRLGKAFQVDEALSSTSVASAAFFGAATDVLAMRPIELEGVDLLVFRFSPIATLSVDTINQWRTKGVRIMAVQHGDGEVEPPTVALSQALVPGDEAIVVGPAQVIKQFARAHTAPTVDA